MEKEKKPFQILFLPCILYACLFVFCRYENSASILCPLWMAGTLALVHYVMKKTDRPVRKDMIFIEAVMMLLSVSDFLTYNFFIVTVNNIFADFLLVIDLLAAFYPDRKWGISQWILSFFKSIAGAISSFSDLFADIEDSLKNRNSKSRKTFAVIIGILSAVPLTVIILFLLASADMVFKKILKSIFCFQWSSSDTYLIILEFIFVFLASYCGLRFFLKNKDIEINQRKNINSDMTAVIILIPVAIIYVLFSVIQFAFLFIRNLTLPAGMTYAEYAHQGFYQLLAVVIINLILVLTITAVFGRSKIIKCLLTIINACSFVMIASAFFRIMLYISVYHLTELRFLVVWGLTVMTFLFVMITVYTLRAGFPLAKAFLIVISVSWIVLSFSRMDYWIADYNLSAEKKISSNYTDDQSKKSDHYYLIELSVDAAPAIMRSGDTELKKDYRDSYKVVNALERRDFRHINLSIERCRRAIR